MKYALVIALALTVTACATHTDQTAAELRAINAKATAEELVNAKTTKLHMRLGALKAAQADAIQAQKELDAAKEALVKSAEEVKQVVAAGK